MPTLAFNGRAIVRDGGRRMRTCAFLALVCFDLGQGDLLARTPDWLVTSVRTPATFTTNHTGREFILENGLISRTFHLSANLACISYKNLTTGAEFLRAVKPEARIKLNGVWYDVGGLRGQPDYGYLDASWLPTMTNSPTAFQGTGFTVSKPVARYAWQPKHNAAPADWPENGLVLNLEFVPPSVATTLRGLKVTVHYEMFAGLPVLSKWITIKNDSGEKVRVDGCESEYLAVTQDQAHRLHLESDYAFNTMDTTDRGADPDYLTRAGVNGPNLGFPDRGLLVKSHFPMGPAVALETNGSFDSFITFELLHDQDDAERRALARRRMYRVISPQITENPIFMHVRSGDSASIRKAVDQCAETGFEMVIITFWSGFDMNNEDPAYVARMKSDFDYAHGRGIKIGGYVLFCTTASKGPEFDAVDPDTGKAGESVCLGSAYTDRYFERLYRFMDATGMDVIETDGPYHGYKCASTRHKYHQGLEDSQWVNWKKQVEFFHECRRRGIFINAPDWYFLNGSNKTAMGYREENWSLPRDLQIIIARQNIFDGTWNKTASMGWMMLPLVEYHGGGPAATIEPLSQHLDAYEMHLAQNFGAGVQSCYRGPRLFDKPETKAVVKKWVDFYKQHRPILDSDFLHLRRPDGRDIDYLLHVNPGLKEKGLLMVYNPLPREAKRTLRVPLYYTGLTETASIREGQTAPESYRLDREGCVELPVTVTAKGVTWFVFE